MTGGPKAERVRRVTSASDGPVEVGWVPEHSAPTVKDRPLVMLQTLSQRDGRPLFRLTFDEAEAWELHASLACVLGVDEEPAVSGCTFCDSGQAYPSGPYTPHSPTCPLMRDPLLRKINQEINRAHGDFSNGPREGECDLDTSIPAAGGGGGGAGQPTGGTGTSGRPWPCAHPVTLDRKEYGVLVKRTCGVCGEVLAGSGGFGGSVGHRCTDNRNEPCTPDHCQAEEFCPARAPRESVKVGGNCQGVLSCSGESCAWPGHKPKTVNEWGAAGCSFCKLGKCPYHESTIDQLRRENVRLDDKWRDYEENYILPCFAWARDAGIDLPTLVSEAKGNCVERLVQTLRAQRDEARKRLVQTLRAQGDEARTKLAAEPTWDDRPDEWTEAVKAAFPTRSGSHDEYALAMKMVGSRNGKGELVALVNWLLVRLSRATGSLGRSASYAPVKEDVKGEVGSGRSDECLRCGAPLGVLGTYCTDDAACREREALIRKACNLPPR